MTTPPEPEPHEPEARRSFHEQLDDLRSDVIRLGGLVTEAVAGATQALLDGDLAAAERVIAADTAVDDLVKSVEEHCFVVLARQQPMATDLRLLLTSLRVAHELELDGDLMKNVAKATRRIFPRGIDPKLRGIIARMGEQAANQTRVAMDAYADNDPSWAPVLEEMDGVMDDLTTSLYRHILGRPVVSTEDEILEAVQMALVGRHYERVADHAVTIAERVVFMATGERPRPEDEWEEPVLPGDGSQA